MIGGERGSLLGQGSALLGPVRAPLIGPARAPPEYSAEMAGSEAELLL